VTDSPASEQELDIDRLRFALIPGIGPAIRRALLEHFDSPADVLQASDLSLRRVRGIGPKLSQLIQTAPQLHEAEELQQICRRSEIKIVLESDEHYPRTLQTLSDPPGVLFQSGDWQPFDRIAVAIVGTRHASRYGLEQAGQLAASLSRCGYTIVSGLARGIDTAAHRATLEAGGRTIAVLGSGLLNIYPPENMTLAKNVKESGALVSELPPYRPPMAGTFPQRNRLISGLSLGVIVIEAATRSGALITASHAAEQGREVFALPGPVTSRVSRGCHRLIQDGAKLVQSVDDVLEELGPLAENVEDPDGHLLRHPAELQLNDQERSVLDAIEVSPTNIDDVIVCSELPVSRVLATLHVLETRHLIQRLPGNAVARR